MSRNFTKTSLVALFAFALGIGINSAALSEAVNSASVIKIAVVDVNKVVTGSSQVNTLKKQQEAKKAELVKWLDGVKADIKKQSTEENKVKLAKKYDAELAKKQEANRAEYAKKLAEIDKNISQAINQTARAQGYTIVLSKNMVLYGGDDITAAIAKVVK